MVTRVLSFVRGADPGAARTADPALDLNAYAVAEDVDLTLVLGAAGVELALAGARTEPGTLAGVSVPAATPADDLEALLASGVRVLVPDDDLAARGLTREDLVGGVETVDRAGLAALVVEHDVTLTTCTG